MVCSAQGGESSEGSDEAAMADMVGLVQPERVRLWQDDFRRLHISVDGREYEDVRAVRAFPVSGKADYVSFVNKEGKEVAFLARAHELDKESRRVLTDALQKMYYVAKITRIFSLTETMGVAHWQVMTDRGYATFEVADREHIRTLPAGRFLITDADGNRFEIEDATALDPRSQTLLRSEI